MNLLTNLCLLLGWATAVFAQDVPPDVKVYETRRVNPYPLEIDGRLDDPAWDNVDWAGGFTQNRPNSGAAPSQKTQFKSLYDDGNIYFAIRAFDTDPEKIVNRVDRRDESDSDFVSVIIDSYFDRRTAFLFQLTPAAVRGDGIVSDDGDNFDDSWDPVWYGATNIDEQGWTAEMKIPLSQLRFSNDDDQTWGLQVHRGIFRKDEWSFWQFIPRNPPGWVSLFGQLKGLEGVKPSRRIELMPYAVADVNRFKPETDNPYRTGQSFRSRLGLDAKVALTNNLTLDMTANPDFGQVEADPSQVNLSAFEVFFEERRPFFIEGKNITDFKVGGGGPFWNDQLFYSRRIGRRPQFSPHLSSGETMEVPQPTSILSAFKITGKTQNGLSIGIVNAVTGKTNAQIDSGGIRREETVEPFTNYLVTRVQQDFNGGITSLGGMVTAVNRNIHSADLDFLNRAAYSGGVDFRHQWNERKYWANAKLNFSHIRGDRTAIIRAQRSSARFFQRPDAGYVTLDSTRTSLSGHGGTVDIGRGGNSPWRMGVTGTWRSPGFELNDLGFLRQADVLMQTSYLGYQSTRAAGFFRSYDLSFTQWQGWNFGGTRTFSGGNINGQWQFSNYWKTWMNLEWGLGGFSTAQLRGGPTIRTNGSQGFSTGINSDERRDFRMSLAGGHYRNRGNSNRSSNINFSIRYRPRNAVNIEFSPFYRMNRNQAQYVTTRSFQEADRYLLGQIDQKTLGITFRANYSVTPNLSFQYYGQPFISAGLYSKLKRVTNPRADRVQDRFHTFSANEIIYDATEDKFDFDENRDGTTDYSINNPNFKFRQFRSNFVMRWEYTPGSTLFLVWAQERTGFGSQGNFSAGNDLKALFEVYPSNFFLVKFNRWFSI